MPHEDPLVITQTADIVADRDYLSRGYIFIWLAKELGAKTFVLVSFPRHLSYESIGRQRAIMEVAAKDLGVNFVLETAPDPTSDVGTAGAQQFILEKVPQWLKKYGPNGEKVAFFATNLAETEPLIKQLLAAKNGVLVDASLLIYPGALGIDLSQEKGDFPAILKKIDDSVVAKKGENRFVTWAYSMGFTTSAALGEFAKRVIDGKAQKDKLEDLLAAFEKYTPGSKFNATYNVDGGTGKQLNNYILLYQDSYVFGKGFLPTTKQQIDPKYYQIKSAKVTK